MFQPLICHASTLVDLVHTTISRDSQILSAYHLLVVIF